MIQRIISVAFAAVVACAQTPSARVAPRPVETKPAQAHWEMKYLYDEDDSSLVLLDLQFPSPKRGIASGTIVENSRSKNVVVITADGGETWDIVPVKEPGYSLFFLNESVGWMVTPKAIWKTIESGRSWKKIPKTPKLARRVHFLDEANGYALCGLKSVYTTADGGATWNLLAASQEPSANPEYTAYEAVDFQGSRGLITGWSSPPRREARLPDWMEPEKAKLRREWPTLNIVLETLDGGKNWKSSTAPIFGRISRIDVAGDSRGLALLAFQNAFEVPSAVISIDSKTGKSTTVYSNRNRKVTDLLLFTNGSGYLAAIESIPGLPNSPVPGKLKIIRSNDFSQWEEMEVDYRASGTRAMLAAPDDANVWVATNSGAILKLSAF